MVKAGRPLPLTSVVTVVSKVVSSVLRRQKKTLIRKPFSDIDDSFLKLRAWGGGSQQNASNGRSPLKPSYQEHLRVKGGSSK